MRSRYFTLLMIGILTSSCASGKFFNGPDESLSFEIFDQFESSIPGFDGTLKKPISCDIDENGLIYILDEDARQIVVLSPDMEVIRLIGNPDESPQEQLLSFGQNRSRISVGGGIVAHSDMGGSIKVFSTEGIYLGTFETEHQAHDLAISSDGHIITLTLDPTHPVISYDRDGQVLRRLGPAFIEGRAGYDDRDPSRYGLDHFRLTVLSDGTVVLFSRTWLRFRIFDQQGAFRDYQIDPMRLFRLTDTEDEIERMEERAAKIAEWPPERVNELISVGEYRHMEMGSVTSMHTGLGVTSTKDSVWLFSGQRLVECDARGRIRRLIDTGLDGYGGLRIQDGLVVLYHWSDGSLAIGRIPKR